MKNVIKGLIIIILFVFPNFMTAQQMLSARVLDSETHKPVELVAVMSSIDNTITNSEGGFMLKVDSNDSIKLYHVSYGTCVIPVWQLNDSILLQSKVYELPEIEIVAIPRSEIVRELSAVWDKYYQLLKNKKDNDFPMQTFYYRQLTQNDNVYVNYIECFFIAPTTIGVTMLSLQEGRFATIKKDSIGFFKNFFYLSQIFPLSRKEAMKKNTINSFLVKDFEKYYDLRIAHVISQGNNDEVKVYQFIPYNEMVSKNAVMLSGFLYIRTKDHSIVRMEASTKNVGLIDFPNVKDGMYYFTVTYRDGIESYPIVESVKSEAEIELVRNGQSHLLKVSSILFATDYPLKSKGKKVKQNDFLLKKVAESKYNQKFWDNNPIIKRTKIEQQVMDDFNGLGYFGSMKFNE